MPFNELTPGAMGLFSRLKLPPVNQLGIVVRDLGAGVAYYRRLLSISNWYRPRISGIECTYHGRPIDITYDIAVGYTGGIQVELIQAGGHDGNVYTETLGRGGAGFHHLGVTVRDIDGVAGTLKKAGITPLQEGTIRSGRAGVTRFAYFDTMESAGFILELIESRAFGLSVGMPEWLMNAGRLTGDTEPIR